MADMQLRPVRRSYAAPLVLIVLGVALLLANLGYFPWQEFGRYFANYWPVLLILWGAIKLLEYRRDQQAGLSSRGLGAGGVLFLILLILAGLAASAAMRVGRVIRSEVDLDHPIAALFGNRYTFESTLEQPFPADAALSVVSGRGDITVRPWDQQQLRVVVHKSVAAGDEQSAQRIDKETQPTAESVAGVVTLRSNNLFSSAGGIAETALEIFVPASVAVEINSQRGNLVVHDRKAGLRITSAHGDVSLRDVDGAVTLGMRRGSLHAENISGNLDVNGRVDDTTVAGIGGSLNLSGDFFGNTSISKVAGAVTFKSPRSDVVMTRLDGDLEMESSRLRAKGAHGPVRVETRSKDIRLAEVSGNVRIQNANGSVEVEFVTPGTTEIENVRGDVTVAIPENAGFQAEVTTRRGEISSDFEGFQSSSEDNQNRSTGVINGGGTRIQVSTRDGDVHLRKRSTLPEASPAKPAPAAPKGTKTAMPVRAGVDLR